MRDYELFPPVLAVLAAVVSAAGCEAVPSPMMDANMNPTMAIVVAAATKY